MIEWFARYILLQRGTQDFDSCVIKQQNIVLYAESRDSVPRVDLRIWPVNQIRWLSWPFEQRDSHWEPYLTGWQILLNMYWRTQNIRTHETERDRSRRLRSLTRNYEGKFEFKKVKITESYVLWFDLLGGHSQEKLVHNRNEAEGMETAFENRQNENNWLGEKSQVWVK